MEAIRARSGVVARVELGKPGPYLPLMSEVRKQLLILESAVALAQATVQPKADVEGWDALAIRKAAALINAIDAADAWVRASVSLAHIPSYSPRLAKWLSSERIDESAASLADAQFTAAAALKHFDELRELRPNELMAKTLLKSVFAAAGTVQELALQVHATVRTLSEQLANDRPSDEIRLATERALEQSKDASRQMEELIGDRSAVRRAAIALLPTIAYDPGEDLPILRIKQESPLEVVVILIGSAGALVAVLNGLLDVQVKYKTRKEKARAERSRLERELAEDEVKTEAIQKLRATFSSNEPERLKIQDLIVFDSLDEAFEDDEEMKAT